MNKPIIALVMMAPVGSPLFAADNYTYLALGDSVPFGMNITLVPPYSEQPITPGEFIGYPETVAAVERVSELNAACPGETSGSFLNITPAYLEASPDNGCNSPHVELPGEAGYNPIILPPFKTTVGLHTDYTVAQMDFAVSQLQANKDINLVALQIGANDILLLLPALEQCGTDTTCAEGILGPVLETYGGNLATILTGIRAVYQGKLILMTYYSPTPALDTVATALNGAMTQVAGELNAKPGFAPITIADGYTAFQIASAPFNHDACQAGLLIKLPPSPYDLSPCDVHPSPLGRNLLAVLVVIAAPPTH